MISVIVPVYNAEKYIDRCVTSIISQTYSNWELYLIDDGSTDNSFTKLKMYEKKDNRIKVIHQENRGAGAARNSGIDQVNGDYVVFVDSDDYIEDNYFEILSGHKEDVVFIDVNRCDAKGNVIAEEKLSTLKGMSKEDILRSQMTGKVLWGGVRKAVKKHLIDAYDIRYSNHKVGEEAIYSFLILYYAKTFSFINKPVYNYEIHLGSLSQTVKKDPWGEVALALRKKTQELNCYEKYADTLNGFIYTAMVVSIGNIGKLYGYKLFNKKAKERVSIAKKEIDNAYKIDYKHMKGKAKIMMPFIKMKFWHLVYIACKLR